MQRANVSRYHLILYMINIRVREISPDVSQPFWQDPKALPPAGIFTYISYLITGMTPGKPTNAWRLRLSGSEATFRLYFLRPPFSPRTILSVSAPDVLLFLITFFLIILIHYSSEFFICQGNFS